VDADSVCVFSGSVDPMAVMQLASPPWNLTFDNNVGHAKVTQRWTGAREPSIPPTKHK
jgi:hypothetical protein